MAKAASATCVGRCLVRLQPLVAADRVATGLDRQHRRRQVVAVGPAAALETRVAQVAQGAGGGDARAQIGLGVSAALTQAGFEHLQRRGLGTIRRSQGERARAASSRLACARARTKASGSAAMLAARTVVSSHPVGSGGGSGSKSCSVASLSASDGLTRSARHSLAASAAAGAGSAASCLAAKYSCSSW
jgi:hypothetical protein